MANMGNNDCNMALTSFSKGNDILGRRVVVGRF